MQTKDHPIYFYILISAIGLIFLIWQRAVKYKYFGIPVNEELAGFYMLRGLDEGYENPSYGVWISSKYSNKG